MPKLKSLYHGGVVFHPLYIELNKGEVISVGWMDEEPHFLVLSRPSETRRNRFISSIWVHSATETIPNVGMYDRNTSYSTGY